MRFKIDRKSINFEYEFLDGEVVTLTYKEPTTQMIDKAVEVARSGDTVAQLQYTKEVLKECLSGDEAKIDKLIDEQTQNANLYTFKEALDKELGKLMKRK